MEPLAQWNPFAWSIGNGLVQRHWPRQYRALCRFACYGVRLFVQAAHGYGSDFGIGRHELAVLGRTGARDRLLVVRPYLIADRIVRPSGQHAEPSHAPERRWPTYFENNAISRRPVMRGVGQ